MTRYIIQIWCADIQRWIDAPAPASDDMTSQIINGELWYPTERVQVVPVHVN